MGWNLEVDDGFSPSMRLYVSLRSELARLREEPNATTESVEAIVAQMDEVWESLTIEEHNLVDEMDMDGV